MSGRRLAVQGARRGGVGAHGHQDRREKPPAAPAAGSSAATPGAPAFGGAPPGTDPPPPPGMLSRLTACPDYNTRVGLVTCRLSPPLGQLKAQQLACMDDCCEADGGGDSTNLEPRLCQALRHLGVLPPDAVCLTCRAGGCDCSGCRSGGCPRVPG